MKLPNLDDKKSKVKINIMLDYLYQNLKNENHKNLTKKVNAGTVNDKRIPASKIDSQANHSHNHLTGEQTSHNFDDILAVLDQVNEEAGVVTKKKETKKKNMICL